MFIEIPTPKGLYEIVNTNHIVKAFNLTSGDVRLELSNSSYILTTLSLDEVWSRMEGQDD